MFVIIIQLIRASRRTVLVPAHANLVSTHLPKLAFSGSSDFDVNTADCLLLMFPLQSVSSNEHGDVKYKSPRARKHEQRNQLKLKSNTWAINKRASLTSQTFLHSSQCENVNTNERPTVHSRYPFIWMNYNTNVPPTKCAIKKMLLISHIIYPPVHYQGLSTSHSPSTLFPDQS